MSEDRRLRVRLARELLEHDLALAHDAHSLLTQPTVDLVGLAIVHDDTGAAQITVDASDLRRLLALAHTRLNHQHAAISALVARRERQAVAIAELNAIDARDPFARADHASLSRAAVLVTEALRRARTGGTDGSP